MDTHHRGSLLYEDFAHVVRKLVPMDDEQCMDLLCLVDANRSGTVSLDEVELFVLGESSEKKKKSNNSKAVDSSPQQRPRLPLQRPEDDIDTPPPLPLQVAETESLRRIEGRRSHRDCTICGRKSSLPSNRR